MGNVGLLSLGSFALWFEATVKLLSSAHQGGRHIAKTQHASRPMACLTGQTTSERCPRFLGCRESCPPLWLLWLPQFCSLEFIAVRSPHDAKVNPTNETMLI